MNHANDTFLSISQIAAADGDGVRGRNISAGTPAVITAAVQDRTSWCFFNSLQIVHEAGMQG